MCADKFAGKFRVKESLIKDGNFTRPTRMLLSIFGIVMCGIGLWLDIYLIALVGMLVGAVGMYASKAAAVRIKPFGRGDNR